MIDVCTCGPTTDSGKPLLRLKKKRAPFAHHSINEAIKRSELLPVMGLERGRRR